MARRKSTVTSELNSPPEPTTPGKILVTAVFAVDVEDAGQIEDILSDLRSSADLKSAVAQYPSEPVSLL